MNTLPMICIEQVKRCKCDTTQHIKIEERHKNWLNPRINDRFIFDYRMGSSQDLYTIMDPKTAGYT
jgi:hypothetical protein